MAYVTIEGLIERYGNDVVLVSVDRDGDGVYSPEETASIQDALDESSDFIDSYLKAAKYIVPMDPAPIVLKRATCEIAIYLLSLSIGPYTEEKRVRYENWLKWLEMLAKGEVVLDGPKDDPIENSFSGITVSNRNQRLFTLDTQKGYN